MLRWIRVNSATSQSRLLVLGAVLIVAGIGTPVAAILAGGPDAAAPQHSAVSPTPDEWLDPSSEPELFAPVDEPGAAETTEPARTGSDGRVPPGSGSRKMPATRPPKTSASARPASAAVSVPAATSTTTAAPEPPAEEDPPVLLPLPLPHPVETGPPVVVPPPPLPEE